MTDAAASLPFDLQPDELKPYYRGSGGLEVGVIIRDWGLGHYLANCLEYTLRAGRKTADGTPDRRKALFNLVEQQAHLATYKAVLLRHRGEVPQITATHVYEEFQPRPLDYVIIEGLYRIANDPAGASSILPVLIAALQGAIDLDTGRERQQVQQDVEQGYRAPERTP